MMARTNPGTLPTTILVHLADGACRTIEELEKALGLSRRQVSDGAAKLAYRKFLCRMERGCYQLTELGLKAAGEGQVIKSGPIGPDTGKVRAKVSNTFRDRAWRSMRVRRQFTIADIVADAAADGDTDPESNVGRYLRALGMAGYVKEMRERAPGTRLTSNGFKRFVLVKDTGPVAPVYRPKARTLHDYNLQEEIACHAK